MDYKQQILNKLLSARFLLTVMISISFCYMIVTNQLSSDVYLPILSSIITYYFMRSDRTTIPKV